MVNLQQTPFSTTSPLIASFDYSDIDSGTGLNTYYAGKAGGNYILNDKLFYSEQLKTEAAASTTGTDTKVLDIDFDLTEFQISKTVKGVANVTIPLSYKNGGSSTSNRMWAVVKVKKWNGTTETTIGTGTGSEWTNSSPAGTSTTFYNFNTIFFDVDETYFSIGETLRITIEIWNRTSFSRTIILPHSPKDQLINEWSTLNDSDALDLVGIELNIPFKLDL